MNAIANREFVKHFSFVCTGSLALYKQSVSTCFDFRYENIKLTPMLKINVYKKPTYITNLPPLLSPPSPLPSPPLPPPPHRATGGELFRKIAIDPLPEDKAREVVYQILDGVQHLHTLNIVHLDLKVSGGNECPTTITSIWVCDSYIYIIYTQSNVIAHVDLRMCY